MKNQFSLIGHW